MTACVNNFNEMSNLKHIVMSCAYTFVCINTWYRIVSNSNREYTILYLFYNIIEVIYVYLMYTIIYI